MRSLIFAVVASLAYPIALAQGRLSSAIEGFNRGYAQGQQQRAMAQQEEMLEEQAKMRRLEMRERSGLRQLRALEEADKRALARLAEVLAER